MKRFWDAIKYGNISSLDDIDWYRIDVEANTTLNIEFYHVPDKYQYNLFQVSILNEKEDVLASSMVYAPDHKTLLTTHLSLSGSYYVVVETACTALSGRCQYMLTNEYRISVSTFSTNLFVVESEPNNTMEQATNFKNGGIAYGQISSQSDVDYYEITTESASDIRIDFLHSGDNYQYNLYHVDVLNSSSELLNSTDIYAPDTRTGFGVSVGDAGSYYVKVSGCQSGSRCELNRTNPYYIQAVISPIDEGNNDNECQNKVIVIPLF